MRIISRKALREFLEKRTPTPNSRSKFGIG
jgi:hypothetical protein